MELQQAQMPGRNMGAALGDVSSIFGVMVW